MKEWTLIDDGTLDTVVECYCPKCGLQETERFSQDYRLEFVDDAGDFSFDAMVDDIETSGYGFCDCDD